MSLSKQISVTCHCENKFAIPSKEQRSAEVLIYLSARKALNQLINPFVSQCVTKEITLNVTADGDGIDGDGKDGGDRDRDGDVTSTPTPYRNLFYVI